MLFVIGWFSLIYLFFSLDIKGKRKLEQVASYSLFGNVLNMQVVRLGNNTRDSILLVFKDAKVNNYFQIALDFITII